MPAPAFLIPFIPILTAILVSAAGRILALIGFTVVTYYGISYLTDELFNYINSISYQVDYKIRAFISMFQIIPAFKLICSAYVAKYALNGFKKVIIGGA